MSKLPPQAPARPPSVAVVALQGDFAKHVARLRELGAEAYEARLPSDIERAQAIVLPGGESTTIGKLLVRYGMDKAIVAAHERGVPIYGTCAGLILLAKQIQEGTQERGGQNTLGLLDATVARNAFGRQIDSFEATIDSPALAGASHPLSAVFIRAPSVVRQGPGVETLGTYEGRPVLVKQGSILASTFHPELTPDTRIHRYFLSLIQETPA